MSLLVVRCAGGPRQRGRAVGGALAEPIGRSLDLYRSFLERRGVATEATFPDLVEEIEGMAEGAGARPWELFAANAWEELEPILAAIPVERCTAFAVTGPGGTVLGHNEQWYAGDAGNVAVVVAGPDRGPAFASPSVAACLPAVGMNAAGLAQGVMSLSARDDGEGVPRVPVSSSALRSGDPEDLVGRATVPGRSGGYAYVVAEAGGRTFTVETSAARHALLPDVAAHTNHYLASGFADDGRLSDGSVSRLERLRTLLAERNPQTPQDAMDLLRDHDGDPQSICVHPDPADGDEAVSVLFSMVCHLEERKMWVAAGNPCTAPFEEIDAGGVLG